VRLLSRGVRQAFEGLLALGRAPLALLQGPLAATQVRVSIRTVRLN